MDITLRVERPGPSPALGTDDAIIVDRLSKRYGGRVAVDDLSFRVPSGAMAGLIGPNGAGKTTLMAMLLGLVRPSTGTALVLGRPITAPAHYLPRVGALIEGPAFQPGASGRDNLRSLAVLGGHDPDQSGALLETVGLAGRGGDRYGRYSFGMKQRLSIAAALLGDPDLVVLDEPTNGLDPVGIQDMRHLVREIAAGDRTVLVSSHLLSELEQVCDWLIVIDHGGLVYVGPPAGLGGATVTILLRPLRSDQGVELAAIVERQGLSWEPGPGPGDPTTNNDGAGLIRVSVAPGGDHRAHLVAAGLNAEAHAAGIVLSELRVDRADLEARYLRLVGGAGPPDAQDDCGVTL